MKTYALILLCAFTFLSCSKKKDAQLPMGEVIDRFAGNYNCYYMYTSIVQVSEPTPNTGTHYDTAQTGYKQLIIKKHSADSFTIDGMTKYIATCVFYLDNNYSYEGELFERNGINIRYFLKEDSISIFTTTTAVGSSSSGITYTTYYMGRKQ